MYLREGEVTPFWYGYVGYDPRMFRMLEVRLIPFCFIKRFWLWTLTKIRPNRWDRLIVENEHKIRHEIQTEIEHQLVNSLKELLEGKFNKIWNDIMEKQMELLTSKLLKRISDLETNTSKVIKT